MVSGVREPTRWPIPHPTTRELKWLPHTSIFASLLHPSHIPPHTRLNSAVEIRRKPHTERIGVKRGSHCLLGLEGVAEVTFARARHTAFSIHQQTSDAFGLVVIETREQWGECSRKVKERQKG